MSLVLRLRKLNELKTMVSLVKKNIDFALEKCLAPEIIFSKHDCAVYLLYQMLVTDTIG